MHSFRNLIQKIFLFIALLYFTNCNFLNLLECGSLTCTDKSRLQRLAALILATRPGYVSIEALDLSGASDDPNTYAGTPGKLSDAAWNEQAVRDVLQVFAFGGPATDEQIKIWADLKPEAAIIQMLTMRPVNPYLDNAEEGGNLPLAPGDLSLSRLSIYFGNGNFARTPANFDQNNRFGNSNGYTLMQAIRAKGVNPFRLKLGFIETNYHMATNLDKNVNPKQMVRYFDEISNDIAKGSLGQAYQVTLVNASLSAAVATQYNHRKNTVQGANFFGNEDFAREYHQLFFGILGTGVNGDCVVGQTVCSGNPESYDEHEKTTIPQTARALAGITVEGNNDFLPDTVTFNSVVHPSGNLKIYAKEYGGNNSKERFDQFGTPSINHPESLQFLPVRIVQFLADENLDTGNIIYGTSTDLTNKLSRIREIWRAMSNKNIVEFIRKYAISDAFHNSSRVKYKDSVDRIGTNMNLLSLGNSELIVEPVNSWSKLQGESITPFRPEHDVFGGQTGLEASNTDDIFIRQYNSARTGNFGLTTTSTGNVTTQVKNFQNIFPSKGRNIKVTDMTEFLWKRFTGDHNLTYLTIIERAQIYSLLASGRDFAYNISETCRTSDSNCKDATVNDTIVTAAVINTNITLYRDYEGDVLFKTGQAANGDNTDTDDKDSRRIGYAIDFILATPFAYVQVGR
ncbi:MAG: DUF1800 family protein [Leptospiraceae bacterium]|nr:DUF1800 family protein [Leptospiraceae bacterium]